MPQSFIKRDNQWLKKQLDTLFERYFSDIKRKNEIIITFGRPTRTRLGSIRLTNDKKSKIIINGLFRDFFVPLAVIQSVITHEVTHYIQGFGSELQKLSEYPHRCSLVDREMKDRGLSEILKIQKKWIKEHWQKFADTRVPRRYGYIRKNQYRRRRMRLWI